MSTIRNKEIADIVLATASKSNEYSKEFIRLAALRDATQWYRFGKRRRVKKEIAAYAAMHAMTAVMGAAQIAAAISRPIPKYPSGI